MATSNAVTLGVADAESTKARVLGAFEGREQGAFISFATVELLWKVITPKRWQLLRLMTGAGPLAIRELARRVGRDVKSVHGDVSALLKAGVIDRTEDGRIEFPYGEIHVDFVLRAA
ncbi:MAG TPA: transcriptional regulator [Stellaceae bacterium]|jgi:predicted transcriptional regulator|nr:transcriptional regulator [Stellaceae bacterium]